MARSCYLGSIVVSVVVLATFLPFVLSVPHASAVSAALVSPAAGVREPLTMSSHLMTVDEMSALKSSIGVRDTSLDYNLLFDGHGTGFAPPTADEWTSLVGQLKVVDSVQSLTAYPSSFDFSSSPSFPIVGNQASQGSCSAWASTYYSFGYMEALDYGWTDAKTGAAEHLFSPAWTYNKVNGGRDSGSWMIDNFWVIRDWGAASMATMPYDDTDYLSWGSSAAFREAPPHTLVDGYALAYSGSSTIDSIKALLTNHVPVSFAMDANEFTSGFSDGDYIISSVEYASTSLNHAQTLVGYDDTITDDGNVGAFRVVNSWGADWGEAGYYWITYDTILELGSLGVLTLNFLEDAVDYTPSIVGVWHFNEASMRSAVIEVGIGPASTPLATKVPYYAEDRTVSHLMPTFMCLDMSEFAGMYGSQSDQFYLDMTGSTKGEISSFRIELYSGSYSSGVATQASGQSADVPASLPATVTNSFQYYAPIDASTALDTAVTVSDPSTLVHWVGVDHHSSGSGSSMQSGDVGDSESTSFSVILEGPSDASFDWKVSSESAKDILSFSVPDASIGSEISGNVDWTTVSFSLPDGQHELVWTYSKDAANSVLDDCAWVDNLVVSAVSSPPVITLAESYSASTGEELTVTPMAVSDPDGDLAGVWYDWGDGSDMTAGDPLAGYSSSHIYDSQGDYTLTVYAADSTGDNVSDSATVTVSDANLRPVIDSFVVDGSQEYYAPGQTVVFTVTVEDPEGDMVNVTVDFGDGSAAETLTRDLDPGVPSEFQFSHAFAVGSDTRYTVTAEASDGQVHSVAWFAASLQVLVNTAPVCVVSADPMVGLMSTTFTFDASASSDAETSSDSMLVRWDWNGDGTWDTGWSSNMTATHEFSSVGTHDVVCQVEDGAGLLSTDTVQIEVVSSAIPEFPTVVVPVVALLALFVVMRARRR